MGNTCSSQSKATIPTRVIKIKQNNQQNRGDLLKNIQEYIKNIEDNKEDVIRHLTSIIDQEKNNKNEDKDTDKDINIDRNVDKENDNNQKVTRDNLKYYIREVGIGEFFLEKEFSKMKTTKNNKELAYTKNIEKLILKMEGFIGPKILEQKHELYSNKVDICLLELSARKPKQFAKLFNNGGPPMKYRWSLWKSRLDIDQFYIPQLYEKMKFLTTSYENDIKKDMHRTFPGESYFISEKYNYIGQEQLYRVLKAIAIYFPNIGYCQGMNFLVGFLLLINGGNELEAFWLFVTLARNQNYLIMGFYEKNFPLLNLYHHIFYEIFKRELPQLYEYLLAQQIPDQLWITKWLITMFLYSLPLIVVVRIWDYIFSQSLFTLIKISVGLLKIIQKDLINLDAMGFDILLRHLKGDQKYNQDNDYTFNISEINPEVLIKISEKIILTNEQISQYTLDYIKKISISSLAISPSSSLSNNEISIYHRFYSDYHNNIRSQVYLTEFQKEIDQLLIKYELVG